MGPSDLSSIIWVRFPRSWLTSLPFRSLLLWTIKYIESGLNRKEKERKNIPGAFRAPTRFPHHLPLLAHCGCCCCCGCYCCGCGCCGGRLMLRWVASCSHWSWFCCHGSTRSRDSRVTLLCPGLMTPVVKSKKAPCWLPNWLTNIPDSEVRLYITDMYQKIVHKMYINILHSRNNNNN